MFHVSLFLWTRELGSPTQEHALWLPCQGESTVHAVLCDKSLSQQEVSAEGVVIVLGFGSNNAKRTFDIWELEEGGL